MSRRIVLSPVADRDLLQIASYISVDNPRAAALFVRNIERRIEGLRDFPEQGRRRDDLGEGMRTIAFDRRVVVAYRIEEETIQVLGVLYGGRDIERMMSESVDD